MPLNRPGPAILACAFVLGACGQNWGGSESEENEEETAAVPVEVGSPVRGDIYAIYSGTAPIEAFAEAEVIAKVSGEVREILVEEGDDVVEGQIMARLDGDRLRLELNESSANLRKLQRDYERNVELKEKGLISSGDFDKIRYEMEALEAAYNLARLELDYTQIRAPIDGVVSDRFIRLGNTISSGDPVFKVTSLDPLVAYLHAPEREYRNISRNQVVGIDIDALQGQRVVASVTRISPIVDPATGTFKITIEISDEERRIKPGMFGRMYIVYDEHENVLQVPRSAILEESSETSVFVVEDGKARRRTVKIGYSNSGMVEITAGIADDDKIVTIGQVGLKDGAVVTVINTDGQPVNAGSEDTEQVSDDAPTD